ncbi:MAG TPA: MFS transporter [Anaerolineales bacterium]|nr:MFS transporter [Anaerolineales bacterium]
MARTRGYLERSPGVLTYAWAMYFCYYLALGAFLPYINLYYERIGLSGVQIGTLAALPLLVGSVTSLFWGAISDAFHLHGRILSLALLLAPLAVLMLSQASNYYSLVPYVFAYAFMSSPIIPLLDSTALEVARTQRSTYGGLRAWGSIGWSISTLSVGALIQEFNLRIFFYCYAILMGLTFLLSLFQPARITVMRSPLGQGLRRLMRPEILIFLLSIFLLSVTMSAVNSFFSIYIYGLGAGEGKIGLAWALAAVGEVPVMIFSGKIMRRIGAGGLLKVAFFTFALRWLLFSFIDSPTWVLIVQPLHGLAFAAFLVGGVTYMNARTPEGLSTTAQAIFNAATFGIGSIIGALLGGYLYDTVGMVNLFRILTLVAVAGLAIFWLGSRAPSEVAVEITLGES